MVNTEIFSKTLNVVKFAIILIGYRIIRFSTG